MGGKGGTKIEMPEQIDAGQAMGEYLFGQGFSSFQGITDPALQERLLAAEARFRPQYQALELADIATMARGISDPKQDPRYRRLQAELAGLEAGTGGVSDEEASRIARSAAGPKPQEFITKTRTGRAGPRGRGPGRGGRGDGRTSRVRNPNYEKELRAYNAQINKTSQSLGGNRDARIAQIKAEMQGLEQAGGTPGLFDLLEESSQRAGALQREQLGLQRADDVAALEKFAPQVVEAQRAADPYSTGIAELAQQQAETLFAEGEGQLSPERRRMAEQAARSGSLARGRIGDQSSIASELLGREQVRSGLRAEARQAGAGAFGMNRALAGDLGATILGRPSSAINLGGTVLGQAQQGAAGQMGPQLFDPNVGINMAMQRQSDQFGLLGAQAQADATRSGGFMQGLGSVAGGFMMR
jgi:hypothetical protein